MTSERDIQLQIVEARHPSLSADSLGQVMQAAKALGAAVDGTGLPRREKSALLGDLFTALGMPHLFAAYRRSRERDEPAQGPEQQQGLTR